MKQKIKKAMSYRKSVQVKEVAVFRNGFYFPVCPQCKQTMEREYQAYCDRCGQKLKWKNYNKAKLVYV